MSHRSFKHKESSVSFLQVLGYGLFAVIAVVALIAAAVYPLVTHKYRGDGDD